MKKILFCLLLAGCSLNVGPHVRATQILVTKYVCEYSDSYTSQDRTLAYCDTQQECNEICAKFMEKK